jgi:hypothetical protein
MCDRYRFIFEVFKKHQVSIIMFGLLFLLVFVIFRFIQVIALQGESR